MKKRTLPLALALVMCLSLFTGCGGKKAEEPAPTPAPAITAAAPAAEKPTPSDDHGAGSITPGGKNVADDASTPTPVPTPEGDGVHIRVEGDTLYFSGTGIINKEDYGKYPPIHVVVEPGITGIGDRAFENKGDLESVVLPEGLTAIGGYAFSSCVRLNSVTLPESLELIDDYCFVGCIGLNEITLPQGLKRIGNSAFSGAQLNSIVIPDGVELGSAAFKSSWVEPSQIRSATLPADLTAIGANLFYGCTYLETVNIPSSVTKIGTSAFGGCTALKEITLPEGLEEIEAAAFEGSGLTSVVIPDSVHTIGFAAFSCPLEEVTLGTGLKEFPSCFRQKGPGKIKAPKALQESAIKAGADLSVIEWY